MFSGRLPPDLTPNPLSEAVARRRTAGRRFDDLTLSNPTRAGFTYPLDLLAPLADARALDYAPHPLGLEAARAAVARDYARRGVDVRPDRIALTASTSDAYSALFKLLADPGDEILVPRPSYPLFEHLTRLDAVRACEYELEYHGAWTIDFDSLARAMSPRTRAVLVVSPNNPTGSFLSPGELDRLASACVETGAAIIADEVFADYLLRPAAEPARVLDRREVLTFSLGGLSKSVGLPQAKLAWIAAAGPGSVAASAMERLEMIFDTYLSVSMPVQIAADELLRRGADVRRQIQDRLRRNSEALQHRALHTPSCSVLRTDGGWSGIVRVPSTEPEEAIVLGLLERRDVLVHPGFFFDFRTEAFLVISLLPAPDVFDRGVDQLFRHFDCTTAVQVHG